MKKALNILVVALIVAAGLQIAGVNLLTPGNGTIQLIQSADWSALNTESSMIPLQF